MPKYQSNATTAAGAWVVFGASWSMLVAEQAIAWQCTFEKVARAYGVPDFKGVLDETMSAWERAFYAAWLG